MATQPESIGRDGTLADQAMARTSAPAALDEDRRRADDPSAQSSDHEHDHDDAHAFAWPEALRMGLVALAAAAVWFRVWEPYRSVSVIGAVGLAIGGWPIFKEAFANLIERRMTMELSMTIAIVAAAAIGEFFTALVITLFVLVAEVLEGMTVQRGRRAIRDLLEFLPREVSVRRAGSVRAVSAAELGIGDAILVNPGGRVPVDGTVLAGHSFVDESRITGESMPVEKTKGAPVYAGAINQSGALEVRAERIGRDTTYGKIIEAVERAERSRAPVQRLADRLAGFLVYFALAAAGLTFLVTGDVRATIAVVIVAGACGIAAGTPLAILGGIGQSARLGAIVKGGVHLETLGRVDTVVLDKTGTLTYGRPAVQRVLTVAGVSPETVLDAAADRAWMRERGVVMPDASGTGIGRETAASAASEVFVARDGRLLGAIAIADAVRPEGQRAVAALGRMGIRTILLTGDTRSVAEAVARSLDIREVEADLLPEDKLERVKALVAASRTVAMVGDGVNDAPALMAASVGVGMGSGTDVARESADVVLLGNDLARFVETLAVARRTRGIIWQNFTGTLVVDALGVGLAAFGLLGPLLAAFIHVASELAFILNSARLLPSPRAAHRARSAGTARGGAAAGEAVGGRA